MTLSPDDFKVADLSLAAFGRKEIELAEHEMPGLMALRAEYADSQPLAGARITGSLHMTIQTAVLIETLVALGAEVRWVSLQHLLHPGPRRRRHRRRPRRHRRRAQRRARLRLEGRDARGVLVVHRAGAALARRRRPQHDPRRRRRRHPARAQGRRVREGRRRARRRPTTTPRSGTSSSSCSQRSLAEDPNRWTERRPAASRASPRRPPPASTGSTRCSRPATLLFPAINVNDSVTKSKFDNLYGCRHSLIDGINRATDVMIGGKVAVVCGYGDVGKGCAQSLRGQGARVIVTEVDPICALQAAMEGFEVTTLEDVLEHRRHLHHRHRQQGHHHRRAHGAG